MQNITLEEQAILIHCIVDPQAWIDNALANNLPHAIPEKIAKSRINYLNSKYLSITVDPETGIETRVENPDYKNRAERDALKELKYKSEMKIMSDKVKAANDLKLVGKPDMEKSMNVTELKAAVKWLMGYIGLK